MDVTGAEVAGVEDTTGAEDMTGAEKEAETTMNGGRDAGEGVKSVKNNLIVK